MKNKFETIKSFRKDLDNNKDIYKLQSRKDVEIFIKQNRKGFLELIEKDPIMSENYAKLLQTFSNSDLILLSLAIQGKQVSSVLTLTPTIVDKEAVNLYDWNKFNSWMLAKHPEKPLVKYSHYIEERDERLELLKKQEKERKKQNKKDKSYEIQSAELLHSIEMKKNMISLMKWINSTKLGKQLDEISSNLSIEELKDNVKNQFNGSDNYQSALISDEIANKASKGKSIQDQKRIYTAIGLYNKMVSLLIDDPEKFAKDNPKLYEELKSECGDFKQMTFEQRIDILNKNKGNYENVQKFVTLASSRADVLENQYTKMISYKNDENILDKQQELSYSANLNGGEKLNTQINEMQNKFEEQQFNFNKIQVKNLQNSKLPDNSADIKHDNIGLKM